MNKLTEKMMTPGGSLKIGGFGMLAQLILYIISLAIFIPFNNHPVVESIMLGVMTIVFFLPLLGIFGIIMGIKCLRREIGKILPICGIILNAIWLVALAAGCYITFIAKVTV